MPKLAIVATPSALELARSALAAAETALGAARDAHAIAAVALNDAEVALGSTTPEQPAERRNARIARDDAAELCELRQAQLNEAMAQKDAAFASLKEVLQLEWHEVRAAARKRLEKALVDTVPDYWAASLRCGQGWANLQQLLIQVARDIPVSPNWESATERPDLALHLAAPESV